MYTRVAQALDQTNIENRDTNTNEQADDEDDNMKYGERKVRIIP